MTPNKINRIDNRTKIYRNVTTNLGAVIFIRMLEIDCRLFVCLYKIYAKICKKDVESIQSRVFIIITFIVFARI